MKSKYLISYSIDGLTNLIGYEDEEERNGAYRQYTEIGVLTVQSTMVRPEQICAVDVMSCAVFKPLQ
jgi:hypothetical protein